MMTGTKFNNAIIGSWPFLLGMHNISVVEINFKEIEKNGLNQLNTYTFLKINTFKNKYN